MSDYWEVILLAVATVVIVVCAAWEWYLCNRGQ